MTDYRRWQKTTEQKAEGTREGHCQDYWMYETRSGQQVAQPDDR